MADHETGRRAGIGSASLILIFIVLCLATFGILSLGNARREDALSERSAAAVKAYYLADSQAEEFVGMVDRALCGAEDGEAAQKAVLKYFQPGTGTVVTDIPMDAGRALRVELKPDWDGRTFAVLAWNVYERETYEIDNTTPVWTGQGQ